MTNLYGLRLPILKRLIIGLSLCTLTSLSSYAEIPQPIQKALTQANVSLNDVSLMITPVHQLNYSNNIEIERTNRHNSLSALSTVIHDNLSITESAIERQVSNMLPQNIQPLATPVHHNIGVSRVPASTMKLITTFIALDLLGQDFTWVTSVYHTGLIIGDTLHGDLIIKGSGDPKLTHRRLNMLLAKVGKLGIEHINGNIILDTSIFQNVSKDPALFDNQPLRSYNASPDGLLVNFNSVAITAVPMPDMTTAKLNYTPNLAGYDLPPNVAIKSGRCGSVKYSLAPKWHDQGLIYAKDLPAYCGLKTFYIAHPDSQVFAARVTQQKWVNLGNTLTGNTISTQNPKQTPFGTYRNSPKTTINHHNTVPNLALMPASPMPIVSYPSLPLSKQIYDINHYSNNVMTEQVLLSLPFYKLLNKRTTGDDSPSLSGNKGQSIPPFTLLGMQASNYDYALSTVDKWWKTHLTTPAPTLTNGSGLCRSCTLTADNLTELLEYAYHHPNFNTYAASLGIAGYSGTIKGHIKRLPESAAIGRALIKTGTLDNVTAMAGYIQGYSGQDYIVVGIINTNSKLDTTKARYALDTLLDWTAKQ